MEGDQLIRVFVSHLDGSVSEFEMRAGNNTKDLKDRIFSDLHIPQSCQQIVLAHEPLEFSSRLGELCYADQTSLALSLIVDCSHFGLARLLSVSWSEAHASDDIDDATLSYFIIAAIGDLTCLAQQGWKQGYQFARVEIMAACNHWCSHVRAASLRALSEFVCNGDVDVVAEALRRLRDGGHARTFFRRLAFPLLPSNTRHGSARGNRRKANAYPVKEAAARALSRIAAVGDVGVLTSLRTRLAAERNEYVRCALIDALAALANCLQRNFVIAVLVDCLQGEVLKVRHSALTALSKLGCHQGILRAFLGCFADDSKELRNLALNSLANITVVNDEETIGILAETLQHRKSRVRCLTAQAMCAVASRGNESAIVALLGRRRDPNGKVREAIIHALAQLASHSDHHVIHFLASRCRDWNRRVRNAAARCLANWGWNEVPEEVIAVILNARLRASFIHRRNTS
jgi:HEAT repeat protein|mmetsp:Transcript_19718/g.31947  ORF Transcript_19718/g.31947 Transcript_19718/m.31947 type:complete len:460 (+) Transcript_19718:168-1547(+)